MKTIDPTKLSAEECQAIQISGKNHCQQINCKWQGLSACMGNNIILTGKNSLGYAIGSLGLAGK